MERRLSLVVLIKTTGHLDDSTNQAPEQDVIGEEGCTPSKLLKLSLTPGESPSDKLSER
jgi:hypothetical protein